MVEEIREPEAPPEEAPLEEEVQTDEIEVELTDEEKEKQKLADEHSEKLGIKKTNKKTFQDRIDDLTKNWRTEERERKVLEEKLKKIEEDRNADIEALRKHNEDLMGVVKSQLNPPPQDGKKPEQLLKELRAAKQKALSEVDYEKVFQIQDDIDNLLLEMTRPPAKEDIERIADAKADAKFLQREMQSTVDGFITRNEWFLEKLPDGTPNEKYDPIMANAAIGLENSMAKTWTKSYPELIEEIEKRINKRFALPTAPAKPKVPAVMGDGTVTGKSGVSSLSDEQRRVARNLFPGDPKGEEKYAAQLALMGRK